MKKLKYNLLSLAIASVFLVSCDDFLTENPKALTSTSEAFSNVTYATKSVLGVYRSMLGGQGYGSRLSLIFPYDNDEMWSTPKNGVPDNGSRDIARYDVRPTHSFLDGVFRNIYTGIERANLCIKYIPKMSKYENGSDSEKKQLRRLLGEALTLRAQFYFEAIRIWGDIPAQFEPSEDISDLNLPKTDRDVIYDRILDDLKQATELVPWRKTEGISDDERITQGAVRGLRARIALFRGGYSLRRETNRMERRNDYKSFYQIARDECLEIMRHRDIHNLNPSFEAVFKDAIDGYTIEPNGEVMFEVAMAGGNFDLSSSFGYTNGPKVYKIGNQAIMPLPTYFYSFDPMDERRDVTIAPYQINTSSEKELLELAGLADGKFRRDWIKADIPLSTRLQYSDVNWPILRFSDVLLMFAEAENELEGKPTQAAVDAFEEVRIRAFGGNAIAIGETPTTYNEFFNAIVKERSLEFGSEGIRKYDLIRWNLLGTKLQEARDNLLKMRNKERPYEAVPDFLYYKKGVELEILNSFYDPSPEEVPEDYIAVAWTKSISERVLSWVAPNFQENHSELMPIPQTAIEANENLTQDYGY
ncbi:RagB/SusD family nutrient uptake outer membrane protein [uncultured Bacteroides sp.]|uniref:RagB/SusD family nutrient uptake outer membrane protein n=1 Tax=uncultured Bacteroides sp. TaxID=162156 RepID=UPI00258A0A33|nr:RagB/SusD family nutrient uptake outer membrane protein [uncultured Bacteroides sp.]